MDSTCCVGAYSFASLYNLVLSRGVKYRCVELDTKLIWGKILSNIRWCELIVSGLLRLPGHTTTYNDVRYSKDAASKSVYNFSLNLTSLLWDFQISSHAIACIPGQAYPCHCIARYFFSSCAQQLQSQSYRSKSREVLRTYSVSPLAQWQPNRPT